MNHFKTTYDTVNQSNKIVNRTLYAYYEDLQDPDGTITIIDEDGEPMFTIHAGIGANNLLAAIQRLINFNPTSSEYGRVRPCTKEEIEMLNC